MTTYAPNDAATVKRSPFWLRFLACFRNPLVIILLVASGLSAATGEMASFVIVVSIVEECILSCEHGTQSMRASRRKAAMQRGQKENHHTGEVGWLRAAVLGANDGILSTESLVLSVAAAHGTSSNVMVAGVAGLVAGSMSMAAGEFVSVHSQTDIEQADLDRERAELRTDNRGEHAELAAIYVERGLDPPLAKQVADRLMAHDALGAHARDELGISEALEPHPIQAALASAGSFAVGAAMPLFATAFAPEARQIVFVSVTSLFFLAFLGALAARVGGAGIMAGAIRVTFWGALAMGITAGVGRLFGTLM